MCTTQNNFRSGQIALGNDGRPYFIGTDNRVHNLYWDGNAWHDGVLDYSAPYAKNGSGISYSNYFLNTSQYGDYIYYVTDQYQPDLLYFTTWSNGNWISSSGGVSILPNSVMNKKPDNRICYIGKNGSILSWQNDVNAKEQALFNPTSNSAYFVGPDSKVHYTYFENGYYRDNIVNNYASTVRSNTELAYESYCIYFVDQDRRIRNLNSSHNWVLNWSAPRVATSTGMIWGDNKLFYVDENYHLRYLYWDGSSWSYSSIIGDAIKPNTKLGFKNHRIYYVGTDGKIRYYQFSGDKNSLKIVSPPTGYDGSEISNNILKSINKKCNNTDPLFSKYLNNVELYPNPAKNICNINLKNLKVSRILIIDIQGKVIKVITKQDSEILNLNTSNLKNGLYLIKIITENETINKKLQILR